MNAAPKVRWIQAALIVGIFGPILFEWATFASGVSRIDYCLIVPILAAILARAALHKQAPLPQPSPQSQRWGYLSLLASSLLLGMGSLSAIFTVSIAGFPLAVLGLVGIHWGKEGMFRLRYALLMLFAMVPVPLPLLDWLTPSMVRASGAAAVALVSPFDAGATWIGSDLTYRGWTLFVAEACSGSGTLLVLGTLTLFMAGLFQMRAVMVVITLLLAIPLTLLINGLRIAAIAFVLDGFGIGAVTGAGHEIIGQLVVIAGAAGLALAVDRISRRKQSQETDS